MFLHFFSFAALIHWQHALSLESDPEWLNPGQQEPRTRTLPTSRRSHQILQVLIAFVRPDAIYRPGQNSFSGTGMDCSGDFEGVKLGIKGPLMLGVEVPPEAWGGHVSMPKEAQERAQYVIDHGGRGMMIWSIQKTGSPTANDFVQAMCQTLGLPSCSTTLPK